MRQRTSAYVSIRQTEVHEFPRLLHTSIHLYKYTHVVIETEADTYLCMHTYTYTHIYV